MIIPNPVGMTLQQWADAVVLPLDSFDNMGTLKGPDWQAWGARILAPVTLSGFNLPNPYAFDDWKLWAQRLCGELT